MLKRKLIWSPQAKIELLEILEFYKKRNGNASYSRKLYTQIENKIDLCRTHNLMGRRTDLENVKVLVVEDYLIFYEVSTATLSILTIWSPRRNPDSLRIPR